MFKRLLKYINVFGFITGMRFYLHTKTSMVKGIKLPFLKYPVYLRKILSDRTMFEQIFLAKEYDITVPFNPKIIIDLGANVGYASVLFANRFPDAKIFAVEPDENNFLTAKKNVAPYKNITLVKAAVWDKNELIQLVDNGEGEAAYMVKAGNGEHTVKAYTIKEIKELMNTNEIDLLKIDIEGSEKEIFENGYEEWLPDTKIVIVETHDRYKKGTSKAVFSATSKYNFDLEISGENLVLYNNNLVTPIYTQYT